MIFERNCEFVPSGHVLRQVHADQFGEPGHVLDLELLQLDLDEVKMIAILFRFILHQDIVEVNLMHGLCDGGATLGARLQYMYLYLWIDDQDGQT